MRRTIKFIGLNFHLIRKTQVKESDLGNIFCFKGILLNFF
jgi:hypothetical protein